MSNIALTSNKPIPSFMQKLAAYLRLVRMHRPIGFLLLLWPTYWALWLAADGLPSPSLIIIFTLGVVIMRMAGCVINDIFDRKYDAHVQRTQQRPLAQGVISVHEALALFFFLCLLAFGLMLLLNPMARWLAVVGLGLASIYPLLKRCTHWPQLGLGLAFSWGIPMAFAAQSYSVPPIAWFLLVINLLWTMAYDTEYAMADRQDDVKIGIKSTAILFARYDRLVIGLLQVSALALLLVLAQQCHLKWSFYPAWVIGALLFLYQQWLIYGCVPDNCVHAFTHNHWFGMVIFAGLVISV